MTKEQELQIQIDCARSRQRYYTRRGFDAPALSHARWAERLEGELAALRPKQPPGPPCPNCGHRPD